MRDLVRQAYRQQNVRGIERARGAGRAARDGHALHIEHHNHRLALDVTETHVQRVGEPVGRMPVDDGLFYPAGKLAFEPVAKFG